MINNTDINSKPNGNVTPPFLPCLSLSFESGVKEIGVIGLYSHDRDFSPKIWRQLHH